MVKPGPKMARQPRCRSAPSRHQTQRGKLMNSAGRMKSGGTDRPATAPATSSSRKRRQPWLSMAVSASQVIGGFLANQDAWAKIAVRGVGVKRGTPSWFEAREELATHHEGYCEHGVPKALM